MNDTRIQFRLSTLFHATTAVACVLGLLHAAGVEGMIVLLFLAAIPLIAVVYVRVMSFLFDAIIGPFLLG
jgi:hypothetical protein